jgi:hypothetical protein
MSLLRTGILLALAGCAAPDAGDSFTRVSGTIATTGEEAGLLFADFIDEAQHTLSVALPSLQDEVITDALVQAWDRGVEVEVVTDIDQLEDPGSEALQEAGVPLRLVDDGLGFFDFSLGRDVGWSSSQVMMSHAFAVADETQILSASTAGALGEGARVVFSATSEDLGDDLLMEFNQLMGGSDATAMTAYSALAKSVADSRWRYPTSDGGVLEMWLGPQERLTKHVIDAVYSARSSIWILTNEFANDGLATALQTKASDGFDVKVVVGPDFYTTSQLQSKELKNETPGVSKRKVDVQTVPTIVLIDYDPARNNRRYTARAMVLSHDLYSSSRVYRAEEVISDWYIDGNLWILNDDRAPSGFMQTLAGVFEEHFEQGGSL